jgi:hypothetical protein
MLSIDGVALTDELELEFLNIMGLLQFLVNSMYTPPS